MKAKQRKKIIAEVKNFERLVRQEMIIDNINKCIDIVENTGKSYDCIGRIINGHNERCDIQSMRSYYAIESKITWALALVIFFAAICCIIVAGIGIAMDYHTREYHRSSQLRNQLHQCVEVTNIVRNDIVIDSIAIQFDCRADLRDSIAMSFASCAIVADFPFSSRRVASARSLSITSASMSFSMAFAARASVFATWSLA
jgi:hypothetical protein